MFWFRKRREKKRLAQEQSLRLEREEAKRRYEEEQRRREEEQRKFLEEQRRQKETRREQERLFKEQNAQNVNNVNHDDESVTLTDYSLFHCSLVALSGEYQGAEIPIGVDEFVMVGRNPTRANIVINSANISSLHCQIRYSVDDRCFQVVDFSTYGTFINDQRLGKNVVCNCSPGCVVRLAESDNRFQLKIERSL